MTTTTAPYGGGYTIPELGISRRWMEAHDLPRSRVPEIIQLLRVAYNGGPAWFNLDVPLEDHFNWKIYDPPGGGYVVLTLDEDNRIVGYTGAIRRIWLMHGEPHISRDGVDVCLHPDWQGRGVSKAALAFRGRDWHPDVEFNLGYETHPVLRRRAIDDGIRGIANESRDFVLVLRPLRAVAGTVSERLTTWRENDRGAEGDATGDGTRVSRTKTVIDTDEVRSASVAARAAHALARYTAPLRQYGRSMFQRRPARTPASTRIETLDRFDERHEHFLREASSQFDFIEERSLPFVNWRFCDPRAGRYIVRAAYENGTICGYAATRVLGERAHLADLLALPGREDVAEALTRDAVAMARRLGAATIEACLPRLHPYRRGLLHTGFVDQGHASGEMIDARHIDARELDFLQDERTRVHLTFADSDHI